MKVDVVVIKGAPGSGKSQLAKGLASLFPRGAKIEVDTLRKMVISVNWSDQQEHINLLQLAARLTHDFINLGFKPVIVVDTFSGDKVNGFVDALCRGNDSFEIRIISLYVSDDVLRSRLEGRSADGFRDLSVCRKLNEDVLRFKLADEYQIDTSNLSTRQVVENVYGRIVVPRTTFELSQRTTLPNTG